MKLGIYGYGNIGKGVELACSQNKDIELIGIFTRRDKNSVKSILGTKVYSADEVMDFKDKIANKFNSETLPLLIKLGIGSIGLLIGIVAFIYVKKNEA